MTVLAHLVLPGISELPQHHPPEYAKIHSGVAVEMPSEPEISPRPG